MGLLLRLFVCLLMISLLGCSNFSKPAFLQYRDKHYLTATSIPPLAVPPGLSSEAFDNYYPVSNKYYPDSTKEVSVVPPGLNSN